MNRILGGVIGFMLGSVFGFLGMILGAVVGSHIGGILDNFTYRNRNNSEDRARAEEAYRRFYEQFYNNARRESYSGYSNYQGGGYQGFQNAGASDTCYANLGCSRSDTKDVIKRKYRKLVSQYHPDRMAGKGLSEAEMKSAEAKFKVIQDSYSQIKREKGI